MRLASDYITSQTSSQKYWALGLQPSPESHRTTEQAGSVTQGAKVVPQSCADQAETEKPANTDRDKINFFILVKFIG